MLGKHGGRQASSDSLSVLHHDRQHSWCSDIDGRGVAERGGYSAVSNHHDQFSSELAMKNWEKEQGAEMKQRWSLGFKTEAGRSIIPR